MGGMDGFAGVGGVAGIGGSGGFDGVGRIGPPIKKRQRHLDDPGKILPGANLDAVHYVHKRFLYL